MIHSSIKNFQLEPQPNNEPKADEQQVSQSIANAHVVRRSLVETLKLKNMSKQMFSTKDITTPKMGLVVYTNSFWICENGDAKKALFYGSSPQCNINKSITENCIKTDLYKGWNVSVVYVETAFVPRRD